MQNDILFDNIYIGHSIEDAEKLAKETYEVKHAVEKAEEERTAPKKDKKAVGDSTFRKDPIGYVRNKVELFIDIARSDPLQAIKFVPEVAGGIGVLAVTLLALLISLISVGSGAAPSKDQVKDAAQKAKDSAVEAKDKVAEAVSSGAEKVQEQVERRKTRSSAAS